MYKGEHVINFHHIKNSFYWNRRGCSLDGEGSLVCKQVPHFLLQMREEVGATPVPRLPSGRLKLLWITETLLFDGEKSSHNDAILTDSSHIKPLKMRKSNERVTVPRFFLNKS